MIKAFLFDLDGTLLPMEVDRFLKLYLGDLGQALAPHFPGEQLVEPVVGATYDMIAQPHDGMTNEQGFISAFTRRTGREWAAYEGPLNDYYSKHFPKLGVHFPPHPKAAGVVKKLKDAGKTLVVATNPVFPEAALRARVRWAGLDPEDFTLITTYENSRAAKPHAAYYEEIMAKLGLEPGQCCMVGNDIGEDMLAPMSLGMHTFFLNEQPLGEWGEVAPCRGGDYTALEAFIDEVLEAE